MKAALATIFIRKILQFKVEKRLICHEICNLKLTKIMLKKFPSECS